MNTVTCGCGAAYVRHEFKETVRDKGFACVSCGRELASLNVSQNAMFTLSKPPREQDQIEGG